MDIIIHGRGLFTGRMQKGLSKRFLFFDSYVLHLALKLDINIRINQVVILDYSHTEINYQSMH